VNKLLLISILVSVLSGCAATGPQFKPEDPPTMNQSLLYIYRPEARDLQVRAAVFSINDQELIELKSGGYTSVKLPPGTYKVRQTWKPWPGDYKEVREPLDVYLNLSSGKTYFLEFRVRSEFQRITWSLGAVDNETAASRIASCRRQQTVAETHK
jgi:hypothetical protein